VKTLQVAKAGLTLIKRDALLAMLIPAPILIGVVFRYGIPALDSWLAQTLGHTAIVPQFRTMLDLMLLLLIPYLLNMAASMIMLEERDEGVSLYFAVSPPGTKGYLTGRILQPAMISVALSAAMFSLFRSSDLSMTRAIPIAFLASAASVAVCIGVVAFANNKVEGLALMKLGGLSLMGIQAPFFLSGTSQYLFSPLPSFWMTKAAIEPNNWPLFIAAGLTVSALWIWLFFRIAGYTAWGRRVW
jgi:fluoroquinolone transport system permease protein